MADIAKLQILVEPKGLDDTTTALNQMSNAATMVTNAVKAMAAAWAASKLAQHAKDAAMLAARYETLGVVMGVLGNNAGYTKAEMLQFQKTLMDTGISAIESRNTLNMMASAQMDLTKSAQLARVAQDAAVVGNLNSSEAFQRMIYGIQSGQTEILRTIGINVNFENSYKALAKELKKNVADLTEQEKVQARMNIVLAKGKDIAGAYEASMGTVSKQLASSKRYAEDLTVSIGSVFGGVASVAVNEYVNALKQAQTYMQGHKIEASATAGLLEASAKNAADIVKNIMELASASGQVAGDFTLMELAAGGLLAVTAILKDTWNIISGTVQTVVSGITTAASGLAYLLSLGKSQTMRNWYDYNLDWAGNAQKRLGSGLRGTSIAEAMTGGAEGSGGPAERSIEQEREKIKKGKEAREEAARKAKAEADAKKAAEAYAKELERQLGFMRGMRDELEKSVYSEDELLQIRIKRANLSPAMEREAQAMAKLLEMARSAIKPNQQLVESLEKFEELQAKMADVRPGLQNTAQALLDSQLSEYQSEISKRYNPEGYAAEELKRLMANRSQFDPDTYIRAFRDLRAQASETWYLIEEGASSAANTMADAFAQFAMTGEMSVKKMTQAILTDLIRLTSQSAFRQLLNLGMGFLTGGGGTEGVSTGTTFTPPALDAIPTAVGPRGGIGGMTVNVSVANQGATVDAQGGGAIGKKMGEAMRAAAMDVLRAESNPGGFLYKRVNA